MMHHFPLNVIESKLNGTQVTSSLGMIFIKFYFTRTTIFKHEGILTFNHGMINAYIQRAVDKSSRKEMWSLSYH